MTFVEQVRCQEVADIPQPSSPALSGARVLVDGWDYPLSLDKLRSTSKSSQSDVQINKLHDDDEEHASARLEAFPLYI